jgi:C4-dicarboxylate-binding protein DctP
MLHRRLFTAVAAAGMMLMGIHSDVQAETFNLRIGSAFASAPTVYVNEAEKYFVPEVVRRVKEKTGHTITFTEAYGGSVAKANETLAAVENGLLDIGLYCVCFELSRMSLNNFPFWVPFGPESAEVAIRAARKVYDEHPALTAPMKRHNQVLLGLAGFDNYHIGSTFSWEKLSDLKGRKIGAAGPNLPWLQGSGAVGVSTTLPEAYNALKSGIFEGFIMFPSAYNGYKFYEPAPHYKQISLGAVGVMVMTINSRSLARLPQDVQKIIAEVGRDYEVRVGKALDQSNAAGLERLKAAGAQVSQIAPAARREWAEGLKDWPAKAAKDIDRRGMPGLAVLKSYVAALKAEGWVPPVEYPLQ